MTGAAKRQRSSRKQRKVGRVTSSGGKKLGRWGSGDISTGSQEGVERIGEDNQQWRKLVARMAGGSSGEKKERSGSRENDSWQRRDAVVERITGAEERMTSGEGEKQQRRK